MKALHDLKIVHRDIKCANLFVTKEGVVKLGDLNVSKVSKKGLLRTQTGTPYYACPEVWKDMPYDNRSDIWSMGCVLYEMAMKQPPFRATTMKGLYAKVVAGRYDPLSSNYSKDFKDIIASCLKVRSTDRPNCDKILAMPGLLNHLTGTLNEIDLQKEDNDLLLKTIRMPRQLKNITGVLRSPQYESTSDLKSIKRTNSMPVYSAELLKEKESVTLLTKQTSPNNEVKPKA